MSARQVNIQSRGKLERAENEMSTTQETSNVEGSSRGRQMR